MERASCTRMRWVIGSKMLLLLLSMTLLSFASSQFTSSPRVFPAALEESYSLQTDTLLTIAEPLEIVVDDDSESWNFADNADDATLVIQNAVDRFRKTTLSLVPDRHTDKEYYPENPSHQTLLDVSRIVLKVSDPHDTTLRDGFDESYSLQIKREIVLQAITVFGIVRGLETLSQLIEFGWTENSNSIIRIVRNAPAFIKDAPAFSYRGLMIDTARHYLPLHLILENLDAMLMNKMNVLHWHLTDSQSFPYDSKKYPELSRRGSFRRDLIYTRDDIETVVHEGWLRGIRVIPEFDTPGHTQAMAFSHPEIMTMCNSQGTVRPNEPLNPTKSETMELVRNLFEELSTIFTDEFVHIGGDEVNLRCWEESPTIQEWMNQHGMTTVQELVVMYERELLSFMKHHLNKTSIVWQEVFTEGCIQSNEDNVIIDVWYGFDKKVIQQATSQSLRVILSGCWYLDHLNDSWKTYYQCHPLDFDGTPEQKKLVVGGHASMWGEMVDETDFMSRVWPRASAVAERLWTNLDNIAAEDTIDDRIFQFRCWMVWRGIQASPTEPGSFCPHEETEGHSVQGKYHYEDVVVSEE